MTVEILNSRVTRRIRRLGFRLTPQRELILNAVAIKGEHATFEEIFDEVQRVAPRVSLATVYRNLDLFSRYRLIHGNEIAGGKVYELASDNEHHHLMCHRCWTDIRVDDATARKLFGEFDQQHGFLVLGEHYIFMGLCAECRRREGDTMGRFNLHPKFRKKKE
jgi:Fur family transcriptional regulator, ferric uptake regulator